MSSIVKASIISLVILGIFIAGALYFLNDKKGPDGRGSTEEPAAGVADEGAKKPEGPLAAVDPNRAADVATLNVKVFDGETKKLLPKAILVVERISDGDRPGDKVYESGRAGAGSTGQFNFTVPAGPYFVKAQCPGYRTAVQQVSLTKDRTESIVLELGKGNSISGRVLSKDNQPVAGAKVHAYHQLRDPQASQLEQLIHIVDMQKWAGEANAIPPVVSGADGFYQIDGLEKKYYSVKAIGDGFSPEEKPNIMPTRENVDFHLPKGGILGGVVVDGGGAGVEGAKVKAYSDVDTSDIFQIIETRARPPLDVVETAAGGAFRFQTLGTGVFNFVVTAKGYQEGQFRKIKVREGENAEQRFVIPRGLSISGMVLSPQGQPVPAARVRSTKIGEPNRNDQLVINFEDGSISTDAEGKFAFDTLSPGKYSLVAWHDQYASEQVREVEAGAEDVKITLPVGGAVSGFVLEAGTKKPIPNARIQVTDVLDLKKEKVTDESGAYYVSGLNSSGQGKRYVSIHADGYSRISGAQVYVEDNKVTADQNFELQRTASVTGRVVDTSTHPVVGARIMAKRQGPSAGTALTVGSSVSDTEGHFEIKELEAGDDTTLDVMSGDYLETTGQPFSVASGESFAHPDLVLQLGGQVEGIIVTAEEKPVGGISVSVQKEGETSPDINSSGVSDDKGRFSLKGLPSGTVDLVTKSQHHLDAQVQGVKIEEGKITRGVKIVLNQGSHIRGVVIDADGQAVRGAIVSVRDISPSGMKELRAETEGDGSFSVEGVLATEAVEVTVEEADYGSWSSDKVAVNTEDLKVLLPKLGGIRAMVVDPQGNPVSAFTVQPVPKGEGKKMQAKSYQVTDGTFEFTGIPAGTYDVHVRAPNYAVFTFQDVKLETKVEFLGKAALQEGGLIVGVVVDESDRPIAGATVRVQGGMVRFQSPAGGRVQSDPSSIVTDAGGRFEFRNLKAGTTTLLVSAKGYVAQRVDDIDANQSADARNLRIILPLGGEITGVVIDAQGNAKNGVNIFLKAPDTTQNKRGSTDSEGRFRFDGLSTGKYTVTAQRLGADAGKNPTREVNLSGNQQVELDPLVFE